jgi:Tat protein secretion system quality control protein TatD with DNase activity
LIGLHPNRAREPLFDKGLAFSSPEERWEAFNEYFSKIELILENDMRKNKRIVGIGMTGLDYEGKFVDPFT